MIKVVRMFRHKFYLFKQIYNYHQLSHPSILLHLLSIIILQIRFDFALLTDQESSYKKPPDMLNYLFFIFPTKLSLISLTKISFIDDPNLY